MTRDQVSPAAPAKTPRRRRWLRALVFWAIVILLLPLVALFVATRSWFIVDRVEPVLEVLLGGEVTIGRASYEGDGHFLFRDVQLRARDQPGPGGEICRVESMRVFVDVDELLARRVRVLRVDVRDVMIRLSERADEAGMFNFMSLRPDWSTMQVDSGVLPPWVQIGKTTVEVGTHDGTRYTATGRRNLSGSMRPVADEEGWYKITGIEVDEDGQALAHEPLLVDGRWNVRTNEHDLRIKEVELDRRARDMCPKVALIWWDEMDLRGRVAPVLVRWSLEEGFQIEFDVEDVGLTLPIDTTGFWARYRDGAIEALRSRARMHVRRGKIRITRERVALDNLEGEFLSADAQSDVVGVPYEVSVHIDQIPNVDWSNEQAWMSNVLATSPFRMELRTENFRVEREGELDPPAVQLPLAVAQALEKFQMSDWMLSTSLEISRAAPTAGADGGLVPQEIRSKGHAYIRHALGRYEKFPYPLHDVQAELIFENDVLTVHDLSAVGPTGAKVMLGGTIRFPPEGADIALRLEARNVPVDAALYGALTPSRQEIFQTLMHEPSFEALDAAGLLPDAEMLATVLASIERRREEIAAAEGDTATDTATDTGLARARAELASLERVADLGPFRLGGVIDLDLDIVRRAGADEPTHTTGTVGIQKLGLLYRRFPYPLRVEGGALDWQVDGVRVVPGEDGGGLPIATWGGGRGELAGRIGIAREGEAVLLRPELTVHIDDDTLTEALYAAIPPPPGDPALETGWPGAARSRTAERLRQLSLTGAVSYGLELRRDAQEALEFAVEVDLVGARGRPGPAIAEMLGRDDLAGVREWLVDDGRGHLRVTRDRVTLDRFEGRLVAGQGAGRVEASAVLDLGEAPLAYELDVAVEAMPLGPDLLELLAPGDGSDDTVPVRDLWMRYRPEGRFDARLTSSRVGDEVASLEVVVRPDEVRTLLPSGAVAWTRTNGEVRIEQGQVKITDLEMAIRDERDAQSLLKLETGPPLDTYGTLPLIGSWSGATLESPFVRESIRILFGAERERRFLEYDATGDFDASFRYEPPGPERESTYELRVNPRSVAFKQRETPIALQFDSDAELIFTPGRVQLIDLTTRSVAGTFELAGELDTTTGIDGVLDLTYEGRVTSAQVLAFLPAGVRRTIEAIRFQEGGPSVLSGGTLRLHQRADSDGIAAMDVAFGGQLEIEDGSFKAGLEFTELNGPFALEVEHLPDRRTRVAIEARPGRVKLLGQELQNVHASLGLADDGRSVRLDAFRADARNGAVTAAAEIGVRDNLDYRIDVQLADVPAGDFLVRPAGEGENARSKTLDSQRGGIFANVAIRGQRGDPTRRVGRGTVRLVDEGLRQIPLAVRLLQPFHATLPLGEWDYADAEFYITGDRVIFEDILFESSLEGMFVQHLVGQGEMDLRTFELDTQFKSRGGVLLVRDLVGGIGDQLAIFEVTGPLWDPEVQIITFPGLRGPEESVVTAPPTTPREE